MAGNVYDQFKSIFRDVDEFVSKDTVNFFENSVQSVGVTVKRFYSNAMQDMHEQVGEANLHLKENSDAIIQNCEESSVEEDIRRDPTPVTDNSTFVNHKFSTVSDEEDKSCTPGMSSSPAFSSHKGVLTVNKMEGRAFNHQNDEELGVTLSTCCSPQKCSAIMEFTSADIVVKAENVFNCHSELDGCARDLSTPSSVIAADEINDVDAFPASPILENENTYEAIDLSPDVKDDGRRVVWGSNFVHSASYRRRNFGYYKKLIQDAFTSRKRLSKEYEHLAIMYGDIDVEPHQHYEPNFTPSFRSNTVKIQSSLDMSETEWELL